MKFQIELQLKENNNKIEKLQKDVEKLGNSSQHTQEKLNGFKESVKSITKAVAGYIAVSKGIEITTGFVSSITKTAAAFEKYKSILATLEGSNEAAAKSFNFIKKFARTTPFELQKVTEAFVKMKSYGLDTNYMRTYGDTAAAMGKRYIDVVEAMADATTGENERLKELGITASIQGQKVAYSWTDASNKQRNIVIDNNKKIVQSTLAAIFNSKYSGAMNKLSGTYDGLMSNLSDKWTQFKANVAQSSGLFESFKKAIQIIIKEFDSIKPGTDKMKAFGNVMKSIIVGTLEGLNLIQKGFFYFKDGLNTIQTFGKISINVLHSLFSKLKEKLISGEMFLLKISYSIRKNLADLFHSDTFQKQADGLMNAIRKLSKESVNMKKNQIKLDKKLEKDNRKQSEEYIKNITNNNKAMKNSSALIEKVKKAFENTTGGTKKFNKELKKSGRNAEVAGAGYGTANQALKKMKSIQSKVVAISFSTYLKAIGQNAKAATIDLNAQIEAMRKSGKYTPEQIKKYKTVKTEEIKKQKQESEEEKNQKKLQSDLNYYTQLKKYDKAYYTELKSYKDSLKNSDYSKTQRLELEKVKVEELRKKYKELETQELNSQTTLKSGFNQYMNDLNSRMTNYSSFVKNALQSTESILTNSLNSVFKQAAAGTIHFKDIMSTMTKSILQMIQQMITKMIAMKIMSSAMGAFGGGGFGGLFANGGVFNGGSQVKAFANGGVVASPTYFQMNNGTGLMGEAGPEAIMPLARDNSGSLGVKVHDKAKNNGLNVIINNYSNANVSAKQNKNGDTVITVEMIEEIDNKLAARSLQDRSSLDKIISKKYKLNRQY